MNNTTIFDKMFLKRFCLPIDSNIDLYETGDIQINSCLCGKFNHIACVLKGKCGFEKG
jgi:hypothetical protein